MDLAPIIQRFMELKREENTALSEYDLMQQDTPQDNEQYSVASEYLIPSKIEQYQAELAAMGEKVLKELKKIKEMKKKRTYSARSQIASKLSGPTSKVLTSSVVEIQCKKDEIKVLLQQM